MKTWNTPAIEEMEVKATAYDPNGGTKVDGQYVSTDGQFNLYTYGPSSGNSGRPGVDVTEDLPC